MLIHGLLNRWAPSPPQRGVSSLALEGVWRVDEDRSYDVHTSPHSDHQVICARTVGGLGRLDFKDGRVMELDSGTVVFFRYRDCARYRCCGERWRFWWFATRPVGMLSLPLGEVMQVPVTDAELVELDACHNQLLSAVPSAIELATATLAARMAGYVHEHARSAADQHPTVAAVQQAVALMRREPAGLTVAQMAEHVYLSPRRFRQVFRRETGESPKRYYDTMRLEQAASLLTATTLTVAEIAAHLGFSSPFHFSRAFSARYGKAPSRYAGRR